MPKTLEQLLELRNSLAKQVDLHELRGKALQKKFEAACLELQEECPHEHLDVQESYHTGGYDYTACTVRNTYCKVCGYLVETQDIQHPGRYG